MDKEIITFDNLPKAIAELNRKIDMILSGSLKPQRKENEERLMSIEQLIEYLIDHPARQTVYGWVNYRLIPYEKHGKRLYFKKSAIDLWLSNGRRISNDIIK